ncbi:hypothetical protein HELRODRAFT_191250 [Helobdella robusta]|uniref:Uncharacterized protein n=1 Tax=Helobdella robusta TaxID=6412 RepID=T1FSS8_HELRO|nr:hypothetical protein HELRODRAFT_191250 [Helobdella robusta]ESO06942.1 hypothetical protein HELRODRAFT_191250 [Helobdella robusta]
MRKDKMEILTTTGKIAEKRDQQRTIFVKTLCHLLNITTFQLLQSVKDRVFRRNKNSKKATKTVFNGFRLKLPIILIPRIINLNQKQERHEAILFFYTGKMNKYKYNDGLPCQSSSAIVQFLY